MVRVNNFINCHSPLLNFKSKKKNCMENYEEIIVSELLSYLFIIYLVCEAIGTAATPGLLCQPRVIVQMIVEKQGKQKFSEKTCPSATFVHHKIPHDQTRV
jgi:hypothetical protein